MNEFQKGQVVFHKATFKRCVVRGDGGNGSVVVTTQDDETKAYQPEELLTEEEWELKNKNLANSFK